jgi:potassium-transporting ATPase potassium-binding subunit
MTLNGWAEIALVLASVVLFACRLGQYIAAVFERRKTWLAPVAGALERSL